MPASLLSDFGYRPNGPHQRICTFPWTEAEIARSLCFFTHSLSLCCRLPCYSLSCCTLRGFCPGLSWRYCRVQHKHSWQLPPPPPGLFRLDSLAQYHYPSPWWWPCTAAYDRPNQPSNITKRPRGHGNNPSKTASQLMEPWFGWGLALPLPWSWHPNSLPNPTGRVGSIVKNKFWFQWGYVLAVWPQTSGLASLNLGFFTCKTEMTVTPTSQSCYNG